MQTETLDEEQLQCYEVSLMANHPRYARTWKLVAVQLSAFHLLQTSDTLEDLEVLAIHRQSFCLVVQKGDFFGVQGEGVCPNPEDSGFGKNSGSLLGKIRGITTRDPGQNPIEPRKKPSYFPLYWMVNGTPYNGLLKMNTFLNQVTSLGTRLECCFHHT